MKLCACGRVGMSKRHGCWICERCWRIDFKGSAIIPLSGVEPYDENKKRTKVAYKLNFNQRKEVKDLLILGVYKQRDIASKYGLSESAVSLIKKGA